MTDIGLPIYERVLYSTPIRKDTSFPNLLDGKESEKPEKKRRFNFLYIICCFCCTITLLTIGMIYFFSVDKGSEIAKVLIDVTEIPTLAEEPETQSPIDNRTSYPTAAPTFDGSEQFSRRSCEMIVNDESLHIHRGIPFRLNYNLPQGQVVCADTYVGYPEGGNPERNPWTARLGQKDCEQFSFEEAKELCNSVGARMCSADELQFGAGQGSGCNGDNSLLFSSTECINGYYRVNLDLKKSKKPFFTCESDLQSLSLVRCCADMV